MTGAPLPVLEPATTLPPTCAPKCEAYDCDDVATIVGCGGIRLCDDCAYGREDCRECGRPRGER